ncbi:MAG TPA: NUDIX hydrolase [Clostridiales bacterium UBA8960]|nr:NUDIX hydrolase [Clostridiales bacterium UBA8960]
MTYIEDILCYKPTSLQEENDKRIILEFIDAYEHNILTRKNEIAHLTSSGLILNNKRTKMLMIHHNIYQTWTWTGGHADGDTDMLYVALKEAKEETGVDNIKALTSDIASIDIIPVYGHMKNGNFISSHLHLNISYLLIADENDPTCINVNETSDVRWVEIDQIQEHSNEPYLIEIYQKMIRKAQTQKK